MMDNTERIEQLPERGFHGGGKESGVKLTKEQIEAYLCNLGTAGCMQSTQESYRRAFERLYRFLDESKYIYVGTLMAWQKQMMEAGYSTQTINASTSAANGLVAYLGHRELQIDRLSAEECVQPELTRAEYLRLLSTARMLGKERIYLFVKIFGTTGLLVGDMKRLTAEAVQAGRITLPSETLRIPEGLRGELLRFIQKESITSGPIFLTRDGKPLGRTVITAAIKTLCRDARVSEEKVNPRCLRKLYQTTQEGIRENLSLLVEQAYDRLLEKEQTAIGWKTGAANHNSDLC